MTITTVTVSIVVSQITSAALPSARVFFELTGPDIDSGIVAPAKASVTLDATGLGSIALWPNSLGTQGTRYRVTINDLNGGLQFSGFATIPNSNCNLHSVLNMDAPGVVSDLSAHIANGTDAHDASAISLSPVAGMTGIVNLQSAVEWLKANGGGGGAINFADEETPVGTIDGVNPDFTLTHTPTAGSLKLERNGVRQKRGTDYTLTGSSVHYLTAPSSGDTHVCDYRY